MNNDKTGKRGASKVYSDLAIETVVTIKSIYGWAGRQAVGFVASIFELMGVKLAVPEHSTLSRRLGKLAISLPVVPKEEGMSSSMPQGSKSTVKAKGRPVNTGQLNVVLGVNYR